MYLQASHHDQRARYGRCIGPQEEKPLPEQGYYIPEEYALASASATAPPPLLPALAIACTQHGELEHISGWYAILTE